MTKNSSNSKLAQKIKSKKSEELRQIKRRALRDKFLIEVNFIDIDLCHLENGDDRIKALLRPTVFAEIIVPFRKN